MQHSHFWKQHRALFTALNGALEQILQVARVVRTHPPPARPPPPRPCDLKTYDLSRCYPSDAAGCMHRRTRFDPFSRRRRHFPFCNRPRRGRTFSMRLENCSHTPASPSFHSRGHATPYGDRGAAASQSWARSHAARHGRALAIDRACTCVLASTFVLVLHFAAPHFHCRLHSLHHRPGCSLSLLKSLAIAPIST